VHIEDTQKTLILCRFPSGVTAANQKAAPQQYPSLTIAMQIMRAFFLPRCEDAWFVVE
jgi:hypothetical protein